MRNRHRILIVEPQSSGGTWHYAFVLSKALVQADYQVALATVFPHEDLGDSGGVHLCSIGSDVPPGTRQPMSSARRMIRHFDKLNRLRRTIAGFRPDIVHLHNPLGSLDFLYFRLLKALKVGVVYTAHDARSLHRRENWFDWARYRAADAILVHSSTDVKALVSRGIDEWKITVIPHGNYLHYCPDPEPSRDRARRLLGLPAPARVVLFFGMIAPYKGLDLLIEAFAELAREDSNTYLVIAGQPLEDFTPYRRRIHELNLVSRVVLDLRYIPFGEFPKYFMASDLVAFPYRRISQSGVLQLAYAYGRPVAVTNVGGVAEAVAEDRTGAIATTADQKGFSSAMRRVLADQEEATRMGDRGRLLAETKYSWNVIVKRIAQVYQSVHPMPQTLNRGVEEAGS